MVDCHDTGRARLGREAWSLAATGKDGLQARVSETIVGFCRGEGVRRGTTDCHTEAPENLLV